MKQEELDEIIIAAELRDPQVFNASRERYVAEISFKAGILKGLEQAGYRLPEQTDK